MTIQGGITAASNGALVLVSDGTYQETVNFNGKSILLKSMNGADTTIIDGNNAGITVSFLSGENPNAVLDGFTIRGGNGAGIKCDNASPTIQNNKVTGNYLNGISTVNNSSAVIKNNRIYSNTDASGILVLLSSPQIIGNEITDHHWYGIRGTDSNPQIVSNLIVRNGIGIIFNTSYTVGISTIRNNTIADNAWAGIELQYGSTYGVITNNIIVRNGTYGIWFNASADGTISYNDVWQNSSSNYYGNASAGTGDVSVDPFFVSGSKDAYYLSQIAGGQSQQSPCVDAGNDTAANLVMNTSATRTDNVSDSGVVDMGYHRY